MMPGTPVLIGVGTGPGRPDLVPERASSLIASADVVFVRADAERAVLFYAEAWRVERLAPRADAAVQVALALAARPGATAVVVGTGEDPVGFTALARAVRGLLGDVDVRTEALSARPGPAW